MDGIRKTEEQLFEAARKLAGAAQRRAFLQAACRDDPGLRRRVEQLLEDLPAADEFFTDARVEPPTPAAVLGQMTEKPGDRIGRYKLLQKIGEGGMGVVYMAEQEEPVRRRVALKIIKLGMDTKQVVARFEAERQALALMDHPNIAKVLDGGATETGRPYFVMELVQGVPITEFCDKNRLSAEERVKLFLPVCQALQSAHQKGIIHRDLKPTNILVTLNAGVPAPMVIDFGVAKATNQKLTEKTYFTDYATMIGTPAYMSPEQAEMSGLDVDTRSDIYGLGVLLYELLTGTTPFPDKRLRSASYREMQRIILEEEPERPSTRLSTLAGEQRSIVARNRGASELALGRVFAGDLDWIVMKCLEKDRTRRYATANGLAADLKRHLNDEPVVARPPSTAYRLQKAWRRNQLAFTAAAAMAAALVVGTGVSTWQAIEASMARNAEKRQRLAAQTQRDRAEAAQELAEGAQQAQKQAQLRAEKGEAEARQNLYAAHMNLALHAVEEHNIGYALKLLDLHRPQPGQPDLRGWEWRYLWKVCRSDELVRLGSHSRTVFDAVFSPKGDVLATCSQDQTVKLWDTTAQRETAALRHQGSVVAVAFSANGNTLATACADGNLYLWDVATRREIRRVAVGNIPGWPGRFAFSPGGEMFALGEEGTGTLYIGDVARGTRVSVLDAGQTPLCMAFSPNGKILAAGFWDNSVGLWDLSRGERILPLTNSIAQVRSLAFSFDGKTLAGGCQDGTIELWDLATTREMRTLTGHSSWIPAIAFSSDGKVLASASADHTAILWDVATGESTTLRGHLNEVWAIAIAPDGRSVATGTKKDGIVSLWSTTPKPREQTSRTLPPTLQRHNGRGDRRLSPDGTAFLAVYTDGTVGLWETADLKETTHFPLDIANQSRLALSPQGKWVALGQPDGAVRLVETSTGREIANFGRRGAGIEALAFSKDGTKLAAATADHKFQVWEIAKQRVLSEMASHGTPAFWPSAFTFSTGGGALCSGYEDGAAEIFDTATGRRLALLEGAKGGICGAVLLPDGRTAATADFAQDVKLWDLNTQKELVTLGGEIRAHFALALSPDGRRLAAGGASPVVRLWDPATRQQVALLKLPIEQAFWALAFSPDGDMLVLEGELSLCTWRAASWAEIEAAEKKTELKAQQH